MDNLGTRSPCSIFVIGRFFKLQDVYGSETRTKW